MYVATRIVAHRTAKAIARDQRAPPDDASRLTDVHLDAVLLPRNATGNARIGRELEPAVVDALHEVRAVLIAPAPP